MKLASGPEKSLRGQDRTHTSKLGKGNCNDSRRRWAWQTMPILQLPPVHTGAVDSSESSRKTESSKYRPRRLLERVENRVQQVKNENGVEQVLKTAEEILRLRRRETLGRWANTERNFVSENRSRTGGRPCCRRRIEIEQLQHAASLREERRAMAIRCRDAAQVSLIATKAMANREIRICKAERDRAFAELVYRRIFTRTGGVVRAWTVVIASITGLLLLRGTLEREVRRHHVELYRNRMAIITRFMSHMVLKRRRNLAVKVIIGTLSAFTNSNAIGRYAKRVKWGSRHLQAVVRRRTACMKSHLLLLSHLWDRLYPRVPSPPTSTASPLLQPPSAAASPNALPGIPATPIAPTTPSSNRKGPSRKKNSRGQGGAKSERGRRKHRQTVVGGGRKESESSDDGAGGQTSTGEAAVPGELSTPEKKSMAHEEVKEARRPPTYVSSKAKNEEIYSWLQRARSKHCRDVVNYERFTIFPSMVELLLQDEPMTYSTRLQAIKYVTALRAVGRLSRVWVEEGYYAKMKHVLPPPPRMARVFTPEEGDDMFDRAAARSTIPPSSTMATAASSMDAVPVVSEPGGNVCSSAPGEVELVKVGAGAAAATAAEVAGEAAVKAEVCGSGAEL